MSEQTKKKIVTLLSIVSTFLLAWQVFSNLTNEEASSFSRIHEESFTKDPINQVIVDQLIYVCYDAPPIVNVYDQDGNFLWCIKTPSLRNAKFQLLDGQLVVYNYRDDSVYLYDSITGEFQGCVIANTLDLSFDYADDPTPIEDLAPGEVSWDTYNVYRMEAQGPVPLVSRPDSYYLSHPLLGWGIAFFGGLIIFFIKAVKEIREKESEDNSSIPDRVRKEGALLRIFTIACAVNTGLNLIIIPFSPVYLLVSMALIVLFILGKVIGAVIEIITSRGLVFTAVQQEHPHIRKWDLCAFLSMIVNLLSAVGVLMLTN